MVHIDLQKLRCRTISENVLVDTFGTSSQKQAYKKKKSFTGGRDKLSILRTARIYCEIEDLGNKRYAIRRVFPYPMPKKIVRSSKMKEYIAVMLLHWLMNSREEAYSLTLFKWMEVIGIGNSKYYFMRHNIEEISDELHISADRVVDYLEHSNSMIRYNALSTFELLEEYGAIHCVKTKMICECGSDVQHQFCNGRIKFNVKVNKVLRQATQEEAQFITQCENDAKFQLHITSDQDCYWGGQSSRYKQILTEKLMTHNILFHYDAYTISLANPKAAKTVYDKLSDGNYEKCRSDGCKFIKTKLIENYKRRVRKSEGKLSEDWIREYEALTNATFSMDSPYYIHKSPTDGITQIPIDVTVQGVEYVERREEL